MNIYNVAIMYHYVRPPEEWKGSVPISPTDFEKQIVYLKDHYEIVAPDDMHLHTSKPKCILTFDDATRDQYVYAFPVLKKHQVPAYFSVMSGPLEYGRVPTFHLVHTVLAHYQDEDLWNELSELYPNADCTKADKIYHYETNLSRRYFKYTLNFVLEEEQAREYLLQKVKKIYGSIGQFISKMYIQPEELKEMADAGMTIGVHCVNHKPYISPPGKFYEEEIEPCIAYLERELGVKPKWYTPAFGGGENYHKMKQELEDILKKVFQGVFTTENGFNSRPSFWLNRIDCNRIKV